MALVTIHQSPKMKAFYISINGQNSIFTYLQFTSEFTKHIGKIRAFRHVLNQ